MHISETFSQYKKLFIDIEDIPGITFCIWNNKSLRLSVAECKYLPRFVRILVLFTLNVKCILREMSYYLVCLSVCQRSNVTQENDFKVNFIQQKYHWKWSL